MPQDKETPNELGQLKLKKVPLPDVEFMKAAIAGTQLPEVMTTEQKRWLENFRKNQEDGQPEISTEESEYIMSSDQEEPQKELENNEPVAEDTPAKNVTENYDTSEAESEAGVVSHDDVVEMPQLDPNDTVDTSEDPLHGAPPIEFPSKRNERPDLGVPNRKPHFPPNEAGLYITPEDTCFNLVKWKGGSCTVQGFKPCPYLGGGQTQCELFMTQEDGKELERSRRP